MLQLSWYISLILFIVAFICCTLGAIGGFAGGVLIQPLFILILYNYQIDFFDLIGSNAAGTFFTGLIATLLSLKRKENQWLLGIVFVIPILGGTLLGAYITTIIEENVIATVFAVVMIVFAFLMILKLKIRQSNKQNSSQNNSLVSAESTSSNNEAPKNYLRYLNPKLTIHIENESKHLSILLLFLLGTMIGIVSGIVGLGCGWAVPPILILLFNIPPHIAVTTALFMTTLTQLENSIVHILYGHFELLFWIIISAGSIGGGFLGTFLKRKITGVGLNIFISILMVIISLFLLLKTWSTYI